MYRSRRFMVISAAVAAVVLLAACGDDDDATSATAGTDASAVGSEADATFNEADVTFVQGMIPHHEQAIEMAELALDPASGASPAILELARRIQDAQDPEVAMMRGWLGDWHAAEMSEMTDHAQHGMLEPSELAALDELTGPAFDKQFAALMIRHHRGAIEMSETVKRSGANPDVIALADAIITAQLAEIAELEPLAA